MVYFMEIYCDGGCRNNGYDGAIAAAAMYFQYRSGRQEGRFRVLPDHPTPTNQRADLTAIIKSLQQALWKSEDMNHIPWLNITIKSDSQYAVNCLTVWKNTWLNNGWRNANGGPVMNQDLIEEALRLENQLRNDGQVSYVGAHHVCSTCVMSEPSDFDASSWFFPMLRRTSSQYTLYKL